MPLYLLLLPSLCLPIRTPRSDLNWETRDLHGATKISCLESSIFANIRLKPTDENDIAELILAHYAGDRSSLQTFPSEVEEFPPDSDEQMAPRNSLRKRASNPPINSQPRRQGQQRSKSTNDASSGQRPNFIPHRSWSDSRLQSPIQRVHEPIKMEDTVQDRIQHEVARICGGFDDLRDEYISTSGERVSFPDFRRCVKDITKQVQSQRPGVADIARTMDTVTKAVEKFKGSSGTEQRKNDSTRKATT